jgi:cyclophilin family peptidyl-prolyl cis-trans isomerase
VARKNMTAPSAFIENLEERLVFNHVHASQILTDYFDNRGQAFFTVSVALDTSTLSRKTAAIYTAGNDGILGNSDDVRNYTFVGYRKGRLSVRANLALGQAYRVILNASVIKDLNGRALDGEFNGDLKSSGDGVAGGNYDAICQAAVKTRARFTTVAGFINVGFYRNTPLTKDNFIGYTNAGTYDETIFHRAGTSAPTDLGFDFVQGGGYTLNVTSNRTTLIDTHGVTVPNEATNLNAKGTIAMANAGVDTGGSQWFFNVGNNTNLDTTTTGGRGTYTVFGGVLDTESQNTLNALDALPTSGNTGVYPLTGDPNDHNNPDQSKNVPVLSIPAINTRGSLSPKDDLVVVNRVAMLMDVVAPPGAVKPAAVVASPAAVVAQTTPTPVATPFLTIKDQKDSLLD